MPLNDTYMVFEINKSHPPIAAMSDIAKQNVALIIWAGNAAYRAFLSNDAQARTINGLGGYNGRLNQDNLSIMVGASRPFHMPIFSFGALNIAPVLELSRVLQKGAITAKVINKGTAVGSATSDWRVGFQLLPEEIQQYVVYPRSLWIDITANQSAPTSDIDNFLYLPLTDGSKVHVEVSGTVSASYQVTVYAYNPDADTVLELDTFTASAPAIFEMSSPQYPYILPVLSGVAGGSTLDLNVGIKVARLG